MDALELIPPQGLSERVEALVTQLEARGMGDLAGEARGIAEALRAAEAPIHITVPPIDPEEWERVVAAMPPGEMHVCYSEDGGPWMPFHQPARGV